MPDPVQPLDCKPLIIDEFTDSPPTKRVLQYILDQKEAGSPIVGVYCCYAPLELVWAMGGTATCLCGILQKTVPDGEAVLPSNLCPLIKSAYGAVLTDTCPFYGASDAVIAETTCDGKKKMFELLHRDDRPLFVMELPQMQDVEEAYRLWEHSVRRLRTFLETRFGTTITDAALEEALRESNARRARVAELCAYAADDPPRIRWDEIEVATTLMAYGRTAKKQAQMDDLLRGLAERRERNQTPFKTLGPRVMVTGCPISGDATKVLRVIEAAGGTVVVQESCSGVKPFLDPIAEGTPDPLVAIAQRYFRLPCSCMTPNTLRFTMVDRLIEQYRPDVVIDVILHACHTYNVESHRLQDHVRNRHGLPFLKIETDYAPHDEQALRTRIGALLEMVR